MKARSGVLVVAVAAGVVLAGLAATELAWRHGHPLVKAPAAGPDGAYVAETRSLPESPLLAPQSSGVYVRGRHAWLRSLRPQLVFAGACDSVDTRWMTPRRLIIECELRSGEPRLLQALVDDVVIELVVQGRFAQVPPPAGAATAMLARPWSHLCRPERAPSCFSMPSPAAAAAPSCASRSRSSSPRPVWRPTSCWRAARSWWPRPGAPATPACAW